MEKTFEIKNNKIVETIITATELSLDEANERLSILKAQKHFFQGNLDRLDLEISILEPKFTEMQTMIAEASPETPLEAPIMPQEVVETPEVENAPVEEETTPTEAPIEETPVVEETPTEEIFSEETPAEAPTEETVVETPAEEVTPEE